MKNTFLFLTFIALAVGLTACSDDEGDGGKLPFSVSVPELEMPSGAYYQDILISSPGNWSLSGEESWCTVNKNEGSGLDTVRVTVRANSGSSARAATLTVKYKSSTKVVDVTQPGTVDVTDHFTDEFFKDFILNRFDTDKDGIIMSHEISGQFVLDLRGARVESLAGLDQFTGLRSLDCSNSPVENIDLSGNKYLRTLNCSGTLVTGIYTRENPLLFSVDVSGTPLLNLNIEGSPLMTTIYCQTTDLSVLDITKNRAVRTLYATGSEGLLLLQVWEGFDIDRVDFKLPKDTKINVRPS